MTVRRGLLSFFLFVSPIGCYTAVEGPPPRRAAPTPPEPATFTLTAFDVGTGLAVLVRGEDFALLYDGGSNDDRKTGVDNRLLAYLRVALGTSPEPDCGPPSTDAAPAIDHVFVSHPHRDHIGLLPDVFRCYPVANVWESGFDADSETARQLDEAIVAEPSIERHVGGKNFQAGTEIELGRQASARVLSVRPDAKDANDASIVLSVQLADHTVLFEGDAGGGERAEPAAAPKRASVEAVLLAEQRPHLAAEVLVVGHHGSKTSSRTAFLDAVRPSIAIISSGPMPYARVTLPDTEVLDALSARSTKILQTNEDDEACRARTEKVGPDADGAPGGCSAVSITFETGRAPRVVPGPYKD